MTLVILSRGAHALSVIISFPGAIETPNVSEAIQYRMMDRFGCQSKNLLFPRQGEFPLLAMNIPFSELYLEVLSKSNIYWVIENKAEVFLMKVLIVYDSVYGNTEKIANAIGGAIIGEVKVLRAGEVNFSELATLDLLIVGSPTQGGRPTPAIQDFLNKVSEPSIKGIHFAAFDTRFSTRWVKVFGYAAGRIAGRLKAKGGTLVLSPEAFFVQRKEGPLKEGELERAAGWAKEIVKNKKSFNNETSVVGK
jgi:flavodoxin I